MDIHQLKQRIDASGKKLVTLGNEYIKSKDEIAAQTLVLERLIITRWELVSLCLSAQQVYQWR